MIRKKREGGGGLIDLVLNSWGYNTSDLVLVKYNCPVPLSSNIFNEAMWVKPIFFWMHSVLWILYIIQLFILFFLKIYNWQWRRHLREVMNIFYSINFKLLVTNVQFHIKKKMFLKWTKWILKSTRIRSRYA